MKAYLILYNLVQMIGWAVMTVQLVLHWSSKGTHVGAYDAGKFYLNIFQSLAVLEILHTIVGFVRSNPVLTGFQVFSRLFLTWGIAHSVPEVQDSIGVSMFLLAWCVTEIIRYAYYVFAQFDSIPYFLQWCRYTLFIVLYPIGVTGELLSIYTALPYVKESGLYSLRMPNRINFSFDYYSYMILAMFMYLPVFPQLYGHMLSQRKKILGGGHKKTA